MSIFHPDKTFCYELTRWLNWWAFFLGEVGPKWRRGEKTLLHLTIVANFKMHELETPFSSHQKYFCCWLNLRSISILLEYLKLLFIFILGEFLKYICLTFKITCKQILSKTNIHMISAQHKFFQHILFVTRVLPKSSLSLNIWVLSYWLHFVECATIIFITKTTNTFNALLKFAGICLILHQSYKARWTVWTLAPPTFQVENYKLC